MKIKLVRHKYKDYNAGEVVDLGEEKNKSMVELNRAVFIEEKKKPKKKNARKTSKKRKKV